MISKFYVFNIFLVFAYANPTIVWNVAEKNQPPIDKLIAKATETEPVILFLFDEFSLAQFSKHASVYNTKPDGGNLKHLKSVIDSSKGYMVGEGEVDKDILTSDFVTIYDPTKTNNDLSKSRVIIVYLNTWTELDTIPVDIIQRLGHSNYVAILTDAVNHATRQKRQAKPPREEKNLLQNMTLINNTKCLFFARRVIFHVKNVTEVNKKADYYTHTLDGYNSSTASNCANYSNSFVLEWNKEMKFGTLNLTLSSLKVVFHLKLNKALGWWGLDTMQIKASGNMIQPKSNFDRTFNGSEIEGYIEAPTMFSYACGQQKPFYFFWPSETKDEAPKVKYGISFDQLQVQPFLRKHSKEYQKIEFTDDVYDCVPFISIAVWMFLVCASVLLVIVLCGISMISSLKTMDRFDDPKAKNLVVNVKE